jgi:hypothetical protein
MARCPSLRKIFPFPPSSGLGSGAGYFSHGRRRSRLAVHETASKKSLTTGRQASRVRSGEGSMSFHVVRHEHPTIFVVNRQTYETYRFTIGDDVALAHVGPSSDLAEARRTAIAFLAQRERENSPGGVPLTRT